MARQTYEIHTPTQVAEITINHPDNLPPLTVRDIMRTIKTTEGYISDQIFVVPAAVIMVKEIANADTTD